MTIILINNLELNLNFIIDYFISFILFLLTVNNFLNYKIIIIIAFHGYLVFVFIVFTIFIIIIFILILILNYSFKYILFANYFILI